MVVTKLRAIKGIMETSPGIPMIFHQARPGVAPGPFEAVDVQCTIISTATKNQFRTIVQSRSNCGQNDTNHQRATDR